MSIFLILGLVLLLVSGLSLCIDPSWIIGLLGLHAEIVCFTASLRISVKTKKTLFPSLVILFLGKF